MPHAEHYESRLISAARNSAHYWAGSNEKRLLPLESRLRPFVSGQPGKSVDVYAPLDVMLDSGNSALVIIYHAAIDSAYSVHRNNSWSISEKSPTSGSQNYSQQENVLTKIRGLVPYLINNHYRDLRGLMGSIGFFLNDTRRQIELCLRHDANVNPRYKASLESLQVEAQGLYAKISSQEGIPFDRPKNHRRLKAVPPNIIY